jgi:hypothetical protein
MQQRDRILPPLAGEAVGVAAGLDRAAVGVEFVVDGHLALAINGLADAAEAVGHQVAHVAGCVFGYDEAGQVQVAVVIAGVDDLRQAGSDIEGVVGGGAVYGLAGAVAKAVADELAPVTGRACGYNALG